MDIRKLQRAIIDGLEDVKAHDIRVFNTEHLSPLFERVIVASGTSNRQTKALASSVRETVKKRGLPVIGTEGEDSGEWIIVDCGAAVAHIMQPAIRQYYNLEEIWGEKSVKVKLGPDGAAPVKTKKSAKAVARAPKPAPKTVSRAAPKPTPATPASKPAAVKKAVPRKSTASPRRLIAELPQREAPYGLSLRGPAKRGAAKKAPAPRKARNTKGA